MKKLRETYPQIMNPRLNRHAVGSLRVGITRQAIRDSKRDRARVGALKPQIIVHSRDRMVMLVDDEVAAVFMLVALVQCAEIVYTQCRDWIGSARGSQMLREVVQMVSDVRLPRLNSCERGMSWGVVLPACLSRCLPRGRR